MFGGIFPKYGNTSLEFGKGDVFKVNSHIDTFAY